MAACRALIFDKDGTLLHMRQTWGPRFVESAEQVAALPGCRAAAAALLREGGMDGPDAEVARGSLFAEATGPKLAQQWRRHFLPPPTEEALTAVIEAAWEQGPAVPLGPVKATLERLRAQGVKLAVVTNDAEALARDMLAAVGILDLMEAVIGYDSGFGAKPGPRGVLAACAQLGVDPRDAAMVGDSPADMRAGLDAGCLARVGVSDSPSALAGAEGFEACTHAVAHVGQLTSLGLFSAPAAARGA